MFSFSCFAFCPFLLYGRQSEGTATESGMKLGISNPDEVSHRTDDDGGTELNTDDSNIFADVKPLEPIATLEMTVGPEGGCFSSGSLSISVPEDAVSEPVNLRMLMYVDERLMPPSTKTNDGYILSPLFVFEPHGLTFSKLVDVRFPPPVDSKGWHLSLMRARCDTSTSSQLWQPEAIMTFNSDLDQVNMEDPDCKYDLDSGTLSVKHFCWHWWFGKPADMFMASKTMLFSVFGYRQRRWSNVWNLTIHYHDNCNELIERMISKEKQLSPKRHILRLSREVKLKFEGDVKFSITGGDWSAITQLPTIPAADFWHKWICLDKEIDVSVQFEHGDDHPTNICNVDVKQGDQTVSLVILPCLVEDSQEDEDIVSTETQEPSLTSKVIKKCTPGVIVNVAKKVAHCWQKLVLELSADFFIDKMRLIKDENSDIDIQAVTALHKWTDEFGDRANQAAMIRAMCTIGCRSQAEAVFSSILVEHVCPPQ
ncbi:uncharacterized protein LOC134186976 [Corticium candelabrum]|uniref:uncharacterized protein LOC134186976 n=1 Tax=Corticium candelabrum TaxID=121492 RepID=UPI002E269587|nr:uncharacterized protein LOC134186976 [Corticium candelabrum]